MAHPGRTHDEFLIAERTVGATVVISVAGAVDMVTAPRLQHHVNSVLQRGPATLLVDLLQVDFMGSAGIGVLVSTYNTTVDSDVAYAVVADGPATCRPLNLLAIDSFLDVYPTVVDAERGLGILLCPDVDDEEQPLPEAANY